MNPCTSSRVAVERMAEVVSDHVLCLKVDSGYEIFIVSDMSVEPLRKTKASEVLAFLADAALRAKMDRDEVADRVRWEGNVPVDGLPAWQESALCWLRWGTLSHPNKKSDRIGPRSRGKVAE